MRPSILPSLLLLLPLIHGALAREISVELGPEIAAGRAIPADISNHYQTNLRCDPLDAKNFGITCKYGSGEKQTAFLHTRDGGATWQADRVPDSGDPDLLYDNEGGLHRIYIGKPGKRTGYRRSLDGGATWEPDKLISATGVDHMHMICDRGPSARRGSLYVAGVSTKGPVLHLMRSTDRGVTWSEITSDLPPSVGRGFVHDLAVLEDGTLVISIKSQIRIRSEDGKYAGSEIDLFVIRSTDGGQTVSAPILISDSDNPKKAGTPASRSFALAKGKWQGAERLYTVFTRTRQDLPALLQICTSDDGGLTWTAPRGVAPTTPEGWGQGGCISAIVNRDGVLGIQFYNFAPNSRDDFDLYFTASADGGATFTAPLRVSTATSHEPPDQNREPGGDQVYADTAPDGTFKLVWPDARENAPTYTVYHRTATVKVAD
jgi:hypothetical protein